MLACTQIDGRGPVAAIDGGKERWTANTLIYEK